MNASTNAVGKVYFAKNLFFVGGHHFILLMQNQKSKIQV